MLPVVLKMERKRMNIKRNFHSFFKVYTNLEIAAFGEQLEEVAGQKRHQ